jgi:hypothetical protein
MGMEGPSYAMRGALALVLFAAFGIAADSLLWIALALWRL